MLALRSGIPPSVWREQDDRTIETALDLLQDEDQQDPGRDPGPQMSG